MTREWRSDTEADIHAQMYGRGGGTREQLAVPRAEFRSYYGRAGAQVAGVELDDRGIPVLGRAVGGFGDAGGRSGLDGAAGRCAG